MSIRRNLIVIMVATCASVAHAEPQYQRPGQWKTTIDVERDGVVVSKPIVRRICMSAAELEKQEAHMYQPFEAGCTSTHDEASRTVKWSYECPGLTPAKGSGQMTYNKDKSSYSGTSTNLAQVAGKLQMSKTVIKFSGERIGECSADVLSNPKSRKGIVAPKGVEAPPPRA